MKFIIFSLLIANITLNALNFDLVELYRKDGIKAVQDAIELKLQEKEYWNNALKKNEISKGYYESLNYLIQCQKDKKQIEVYNLKTNKQVLKSSVFIGELDGDKQKEGDLKTPVGVYNLTRKLTNIDPFYGALALTTNYPNIYDKARGKTGHGIWIHGVPFDKKRDDYTKGCIALENKQISKLDEIIAIKNSALQIAPTKLKDSSIEDISSILSSLYLWKNVWKKSDIDGYLSFYDKDFTKSNGQNFNKFKKYKKRVFSKKENKTIKFSNINIIPYPSIEDEKLFKVIFDEYYKTKNIKFIGKKTLYVKLENNKFKILTED